MRTVTPEQVRSAILLAWQASAPPPPDRISAPTYDDEGVAAYFRGRTWQGHEVAALRYHQVGLSFFTAEAFCYYLPAYLFAVLDDREAADVIYDSVLFHLSPNQLGKSWADSYRARIAGFTAPQKAAICDYLTWCAGEPEGGELPQELAQTIAYLTRGEVPGAASSVERLLQLSGNSDRAPADLKSLSLSSTQVTDGELAGLSAFCSLRELDLGHTKITDAGLAQLAQPAVASALRGLEVLDLSSGRQLTPEGLRHLAALPQLAELKLPNCDLEDAGLLALAPLRLRRLNLTHARRLTAAGWRGLDVSRLEGLAMFGVAAPDALLERLGAAGRLRALECRSLSEAGLVALCHDRALTALVVNEAAAVQRAGLGALAALPALQKLTLGGLVGTGWPSGFPALTELTLLSGELRTEGAAGLARLPALRELGLFGTRLAPGALGELARLRALQRLLLYCEEVDDPRLLELAGSALQQLTVQRARIGGAALAVVAELPELRELQLGGLALGDDALPQLARAPRLRALQLDAVPIGDAGLLHLARCPALRELRIAGTRVTADGIAALRRAAPALHVVGV